MIDCRRVKQLLPLWVGQDLPDAASFADVASHLEQCRDCDQQRKSVQSSLEVLQTSSFRTLSDELSRPSLWPSLVSRISEWDVEHRRDRFNGWIPASVMALAVMLMIAVSIPSLQDEFLGNGADNGNLVNRFDADLPFNSARLPDESKPNQSNDFGTPVKFKHEKPKEW